MEGHQIVALRIRVRFSSITPYGQVCIVAIAADCKSVTLIHRRFDSYLAHQQGAPAGGHDAARKLAHSLQKAIVCFRLRKFIQNTTIKRRIRLTGQDERLSISKCRVRTPHPSPMVA